MIKSHNRLQGQQVRLAGLLEEDIETILNWYCDTRFLEFWYADPLYTRTEKAVSDWMDELDDDTDEVVFGIRRLSNDKLVGIAQLDNIEWSNRSADLEVAIGNPANWGKGWGTEAVRLLINHAFMELNLYRLELSVRAYNTRAIRLYEKLGFKHEGTLREYGERNGERYDMHVYGLLRHEWDNKKG